MPTSSEREICNGDGIEPVIIGAMVLDVHAIPSSAPLSGTTVPGEVLFRSGGVARNIAECLLRLGTKPFMISTLGLDGPANELLKEWTLSTRGILRRGDIGTPIVSNIYDPNGEVTAGVASVEAVEKFLTPEWIRRFRQDISSAPILVVDANLGTRALEESCGLAAEFHVPVWFEPVSVAKSRRIASIAKYVTIVSPNEDELMAMANALSRKDLFFPVKPEKDDLSPGGLFFAFKPAIRVVLENGVKVVILTLGSKGALLCSEGNPKKALGIARKLTSRGEIFERIRSECSPARFSDAGLNQGSGIFAMHFPTLPATVRKLSGAGDCLVGGTVASLTDGLDLIQSLAVGIATAKAAVESNSNVPHELRLDRLSDDAKRVYDGTKILVQRSML